MILFVVSSIFFACSCDPSPAEVEQDAIAQCGKMPEGITVDEEYLIRFKNSLKFAQEKCCERECYGGSSTCAKTCISTIAYPR